MEEWLTIFIYVLVFTLLKVEVDIENIYKKLPNFLDKIKARKNLRNTC